MNDLQIIQELRDALGDADEKTWRHVERLCASLEQDPRHFDHERTLLRRLRATVTDAMLDKRNGRIPDVTSARVTLGALEASLKKRTTGTDGWPLAR